MRITEIDEVRRFQPSGSPASYWTRARIAATHYQGVDLDRLVIHKLEVDSRGRGYGRRFIKSLQRQYDEIHIFPVEAKGFWEKCGFVQCVDGADLCDLPIMTWIRGETDEEIWNSLKVPFFPL